MARGDDMREYTATALAHRFWAARPDIRDVLVLAIITGTVLWFVPTQTLTTALAVVIGTVLMAMAVSAVAGPIADAGGLPAWRANRQHEGDQDRHDLDQAATDTDSTGPSSSGGGPDAR